MGNSEPPRSRFAPIPIETTFSSNRKPRRQSQAIAIPNPELTPEPSPISPSPTFLSGRQEQQPQQQQQQQRPRTRFHPQLIETSRRTRRVGDHGPATRPADKTDITPYTNHIYSAKARHTRRKHGFPLGEDHQAPRHPPSQRETEHEDFNGYLLDLAAKEAERQIEEAALAAFPNSRAREGGVAHFYFRDGSASDNSPEGTPPDEDRKIMPRPRRKSSNLGLNWWHKHMQEHATHKARERGGDEDGDRDLLGLLDLQDHKEPPQDEQRQDQQRLQDHIRESLEPLEPLEPQDQQDTQDTRDKRAANDDRISSLLPYRTDSDLDRMDFDLPPDPMWTTTKARATMDRGDPLAALLPAGGEASPMSHHPPASSAARSQKPNPFDRPFANVPLPTANEAELLKLRKLASPPMLGKELTFRRCPSPKLTKLETDHPPDHHVAAERCRDTSGQSGLWRGYCCRSGSATGCIVPAELHNPAMVMTPQTPATPWEQGCSCAGKPLLDEPASLWYPTISEQHHLHSHSGDNNNNNNNTHTSAAASLWSANATEKHEHQQQQQQQRREGPADDAAGLPLLQGLNERLQREKAQAERDEKISQEFGAHFVTQVYNYLSLGYPAMAREFDEELCRISRVSVEELRRLDAQHMAKGHMLEMKLYEVDQGDRCPRWLALRIYITEWARQHPDLDSLDTLAWGVRERRGSWAI